MVLGGGEDDGFSHVDLRFMIAQSSFSFSDFVDFCPKDRQDIREIRKGHVC